MTIPDIDFLHVVETPEALARAAAARVAAAIRQEPSLVLGLPTGETPLGLYAELARMHRDEGLSFREVYTFNLDEYVGLGPDDPQSCAAFMQEHLFGKVDLERGRIHLLDGKAADPFGECARYEQRIAACHGIDLLVLGIGANGHLGMNEPGTPLDARTQVVTLTPRSLADNARLYPPGTALPERGMTLGLGTMLESRAACLLAFGERKTEAIHAALEGPVDPACPASALQRHPHRMVILDRAAAARLDDASEIPPVA
jgi:glucosamine-6-phosphate deaminase